MITIELNEHSCDDVKAMSDMKKLGFTDKEIQQKYEEKYHPNWEVTVKLIIPKKDGDIEYAKQSVTLALEEALKNYNISSVAYDDME